MNLRRNQSGCYDPTAGEALEHILHEKLVEQRQDNRLLRLRKRRKSSIPQNESSSNPQER